MDDAKKTAVEAAVYRRLAEHLRARTDVQNIDLMILAGFCRNCLSKWYREAASAHGESISEEDARTIVYGMPYAQWKERYQMAATPAQIEAYAALQRHDEDA